MLQQPTRRYKAVIYFHVFSIIRSAVRLQVSLAVGRWYGFTNLDVIWGMSAKGDSNESSGSLRPGRDRTVPGRWLAQGRCLLGPKMLKAYLLMNDKIPEHDLPPVSAWRRDTGVVGRFDINMTWKSGKILLAGAAILLCVGLWSAHAPAQTSAWAVGVLVAYLGQFSGSLEAIRDVLSRIFGGS